MGDQSPAGTSEERRDLETEHRILIEQIPAIVYLWSVHDGLDNIVEEYVSPQIESVLGFRPDEWIADPHLWIDRLHPDDRDEVMDETRRSVEGGEPFKLEYRMVAKDGRVVWLHDVASVLARDEAGRVTRYQGVQLDITARKEAEHAQRRTFEHLRELEEHRRHLLARLVTAQETERRRIAEGIHDETMQLLYSAMMRMGSIAQGHPELEGSDVLSGLRQEISDVIDHLRHLIFDLHPLVLDTQGLAAALRLHVERWAAEEELTFSVVDHLTREPPGQTRSVLYRILQEAITNIRKHSGAKTASLTLEDRAGGLFARIEDDGQGFDVEETLKSGPDHVGVGFMKERAEAMGGWCEIESRAGLGTTIECWLPRGEPSSPSRRERDAESDLRVDTVPAPAAAREPHEGQLTMLTERESEVARLLALGHTNQEIAAILHRSVRTIEHHRSRIFLKLGVKSRAGLVQRLRGPLLDEPAS